ncbi:MAG: carboxypeptidase-like regulatory domain-containing protein [Bacteroidales bacterium]|nr:carboxypeptidase-like regulatory domain-containing protein [Bacteroidales bacterium]
MIKKVKISFNKGTPEKLLDEISAKGDFTFTYSSKITSNKTIQLSSTKQTVKDYLFEIFKNEPIRFYAKNNKILLVPIKVRSQPDLQRIMGKVVEKGTDEPLEYTSVYLQEKKIGTITNSEGDFSLNVRDYNNLDTLCISNMGYHEIRIPVNSLDSTLLVFKLIPQTHEIKEVRVKPIDPVEIITEAIHRIPQNYDTKPSIMICFFQGIYKKDDEYISLSEALVKVLKESYNNSRKDQIKFEKGRNGTNVVSLRYLDFVVQGGLYNNFSLDVIKNGVNFLDITSFDLYTYKFDNISRYRGTPVYVIGFEQKEIDFPYYSGKIYVEKDSYAIVKVDFGVSRRGIKFADDIYIVKNPEQYKVKPLLADYQVNYSKSGNKWNLNSVSQ